MRGLGVRDNAMLLLRRKINVGGRWAFGTRLSMKRHNAHQVFRRAEQDAETYLNVRQLAREKYGWGEGLPVEIRRR